MDTKAFTKKYYVDRRNTDSVKWDIVKKNKAIPMWIADMDFKTDDHIIENLAKRVDHGAFGYSNLPADYYETMIAFNERRHNVTYQKETIRFSHGAIDGLKAVIFSLTKPNDSILIMTPVYPPFSGSVKFTKRKLVTSALVNDNGYFTIDYADIEKKFKEKKVKMMILCSPHNPLGRVWKKGELEELFELCKKYNVIIVSDEVHGDLIMPDQQFLPSLTFKKYRNQIITLSAVSKTFNLAMFSHSHVIIPNKRYRAAFDKYQQSINFDCLEFNALASYYGYKYGDEWLDNLNEVVYENYKLFKKELGSLCEMTTLEGSYLLFVNFNGYTGDKTAREWLLEECNVYCNPGESFGKDYASWVRINLATSAANCKKAIKAIKAKIVK